MIYSINQYGDYYFQGSDIRFNILVVWNWVTFGFEYLEIGFKKNRFNEWLITDKKGF